MELIQLGEKTYCIKNNTNIGIYLLDSKHVFLIDSGNDESAGKKILKIIEEHGWEVQGIINTHSNADHIGGNALIQKRTGCQIYASQKEKSFISFPILEPSFLYGGMPFEDLQNKFLMAKSSQVVDVSEGLPEGLEFFSLKGHFFDMIGIKTSDNVYFLGDSIFSSDTILKYHIFFLYDVDSFLNTLDFLEQLQGSCFVPSHADILDDLSALISLNRQKVREIQDKILVYLKKGDTFENLLAYLVSYYNLSLDANQYVLIGSTIRSYLTYLYHQKKLFYEFVDNKMIWKKFR